MKKQKIIYRPLADRMRPDDFDSFVGQEHLVSKRKVLRSMVENDQLSSMIFWGPPGVGKTTLANIMANQTDMRFVMLSGVMSGKADLKKVIGEAENFRKKVNKRTLLFIDEIHRWSKAQQDALLPFVEQGIITLIGATTENPSFEIIGALLSRSRVFILKRLDISDLSGLIKKTLVDKEKGLGNYNIEISEKNIELLCGLSDGDARTALNGLELAFNCKRTDKEKKIEITKEDIKEAFERNTLIFDKGGEEFYNIISALHKSMRGSDPNASLYWLARMLESGADPLYIARRVLRFASEDIGMANSEAMIQANTAFDVCHKLGYPECNVNLAQAVVYCAKSKKSNILYTAYNKAAHDAKETSDQPVPIHLRNAPTKFMEQIGYGKGYKYNPDYEESVEQDYMPEKLKNKNYFIK